MSNIERILNSKTEMKKEPKGKLVDKERLADKPKYQRSDKEAPKRDTVIKKVSMKSMVETAGKHRDEEIGLY